MSGVEKDGAKNSDVTELANAMRKSSVVLKYKSIITHNKMIFAVLIAVILFQSIFVGVQCQQNSFYRRSQKMQYLSTYLVEQKITTQNRKKEAMGRVMKIALHYQPQLDEKLLTPIADMIYETGENIYGIPTEEWIILFSHEGEWARKAISHKNARGPGQLMPVIAQLMAQELGIPWKGIDTMFDYKANIRMSMKWYFYLKSMYPDPNIYITTYFWGEPEMGKFIKKMDKGQFEFSQPTGKYKKYLRDHTATKRRVEKVLGIKIFIDGLED